MSRTVTVDLEVHNAYTDTVRISHVRGAVVTAPPSLTCDVLDEWASEHLFPYTGTGREGESSSYTVTITGCSDARLLDRLFEFG